MANFAFEELYSALTRQIVIVFRLTGFKCGFYRRKPAPDRMSVFGFIPVGAAASIGTAPTNSRDPARGRY
jgi:hypothetical protein